MKIRVGTRGSKLALIQTDIVLEKLRKVEEDLEFEIVRIRTTGDKIRDAPLAKIGGKGVFTKEIDRALLRGDIDIAVHSMKDYPTSVPEGLVIAAVPERDSPFEVFISRDGRKLSEMPPRSIIGTSSLRRRAQLLNLRRDLVVRSIRGNVDTRVRKVMEGMYDGLIAAEAGISRMNLEHVVVERLPPELFLPAPGQGALAVVCKEDSEILDLLRRINDERAEREVRAERAFLRELGGGCQVPLGCLARYIDGRILLRAAVLSVDGDRRVDGEIVGSAENPEKLGIKLARELLERGARELIEDAYSRSIDEIFG